MSENTTAQKYSFNKASSEEIKNFKLDHHLVSLLLHEPFFSTIIRRISKIKTNSIPTAGVAVNDLDLKLYWNPEFVASLSPMEIRELLKHECYHIIFKHCTSRRQDPHLMWNIATDLAINSLLNESHLPEGGLVPGKALKNNPDSKVSPESKAVWSRLSKLIESFPKNKAAEWYMGKLKNDDELQEAIEKLPVGGEGIPGMDDHDGWGDLTDEEKQIMDGKVKDMLGEAVKKADRSNGWGNVSSGTREMLRKMCSNSINWKKVLQNFIGRSQRLDKANTHKKINRKYPYIHPGVKKRHTSNLAIYIDQSGSVSNGDVELFFAALNELSKSVTFTVFPFDTEVDEENSFVWRRRKRIEPVRTSCGGTCFKSVELHFRKNTSKFDGYIVLTDGGAAKPSPSKKRRCWVLLPNTKLAFLADNRDVIVTMDLTQRVK